MIFRLLQVFFALAVALWATGNNWRQYRRGEFPITRTWRVRRDENLTRFRLAALLFVGIPALGILVTLFVLLAIWSHPNA